MLSEQNISRFFGSGCCGNGFSGGFMILLIIGAILLLGDDIIEWLFCEDMALIWVILLIFILNSLDSDSGCGCC
ncbi:hypothetical protein CHF27_008505 [Romboutsia maritimum]|uniref:Uncharacterized protein n=1 Tax=Romboutsia maritimum TaxID=2020948 RepID=A0A371ISD3_9FIRM|nr:hypothetical protein [Romboutsia maritimum]RDY23392.1 hypothetical protein CHF27_008505 [Romboutsia maritimum]